MVASRLPGVPGGASDGRGYWTVVDDEYVRVAVADQFLFDLRFGRDRAESTTRVYAGELARFLDLVRENGTEPGGRRLAPEPLRACVAHHASRARRCGSGAPARGQRGSTTCWPWCASSSSTRSRPRRWTPRCSVPSTRPETTGSSRPNCAPRAAGFVTGHGLGTGCGPGGPLRRRRRRRPSGRHCWRLRPAWRDRFLLVLLWFGGLRIGETLGLRRADLHFTGSSTSLGCRVPGPHLHVVHRDSNPNRASAKSRNDRMVPVGAWVLAYYDRYAAERLACPAADGCDFVFVNLVPSAARRADDRLGGPPGYAGPVPAGGAWPGQSTRTCSGTQQAREMAEAGVAIEVVQALLGHRSITSAQALCAPEPGPDAQAVEAVEKVSQHAAGTRRQEGGSR